MWVKRSTPVASAAIFVVSDKGESLSPKYAPATTAPATIGRFAPMPTATPMKATPIVPAEPQDVPVHSDTIAVTTSAMSARNFGLMIFSP